MVADEGIILFACLDRSETLSMRQRTAALSTTLALTLAIPLALLGQDNPKLPGPTDKGFLLPNGWTISPVGRQVPLTDLPLNILPLANNRHALVATSGYNAHQLSVIDLEEAKTVGSEVAHQSWYGLAKEPAGDRVWWSGGGGDRLHTFQLKGPEISRIDEPDT